MIDKALDRLARVIELALALAFIFAVALNFTNVIGRYLFGLSLLGSDEVQVFIMVAMTFLGAVVVTRRNEHLRMDVLVRFMPSAVRLLLRVAEQILLLLLAGFVLSQSDLLCRTDAADRPHQRHGRRADVDSAWHGCRGLRIDPADRTAGVSSPS